MAAPSILRVVLRYCDKPLTRSSAHVHAACRSTQLGLHSSSCGTRIDRCNVVGCPLSLSLSLAIAGLVEEVWGLGYRYKMWESIMMAVDCEITRNPLPFPL